MAKLTKAQMAQEDRFLEGLPRINWGALLMPGIWGPAHGFWVSLLFYPLWLLVDYLVYGAYYNGEPWMVALAIIAVLGIIAFTVGFSIVCQPIAAHHAEDAGISRKTYLKRERIWAIVCLILAVAAVAWATYYNLRIRDGW